MDEDKWLLKDIRWSVSPIHLPDSEEYLYDLENISMATIGVLDSLESVIEEYDIKEDFDNKHGAPNAAAPKIFMKYFFVNTKTGEKSGEMLTLVRLDEDTPVEGE